MSTSLRLPAPLLLSQSWIHQSWSPPAWLAGGFIPYNYTPYLAPLPPNLYGYLPPPPPGYMMGYFQGYVVVYDPRTGFIVNIVDLLR